MAKKRAYTGEPTLDQLIEEETKKAEYEKARASRSHFLKKAGIFKEERSMLAKYEFDTDYFENRLLVDRLNIKKVCKARGLSRSQYVKAVYDFYADKGCLTQRAGHKKPVIDAGKLFKWYREKWISDNPGLDPSPRKKEHDGHTVQVKQSEAASRQRKQHWLRMAGM